MGFWSDFSVCSCDPLFLEEVWDSKVSGEASIFSSKLSYFFNMELESLFYQERSDVQLQEAGLLG